MPKIPQEERIFKRSSSKIDNFGLPIYYFKGSNVHLDNLKKELMDFWDFKQSFPNFFLEKETHEEFYCEMVTLIGAYKGKIKKNSRYIVFFSMISQEIKNPSDRKFAVPVKNIILLSLFWIFNRKIFSLKTKI